MEAITIPKLRQAIETRDGKTLAGFYTDDAVLQVIDQNNPPSSPLEIRGRSAISAYYDDVCGRTMTHRISSAVGDENQLAFMQTCTYPNGARVFFAAMLQLASGKIARQVSIQAWDP